jgi:prepilin-type N-terminal cleavage/methylation domain-containing protein
MIKFQKGFTLIELLVVIAIIGILAGILFVAIDPLAQTNKAEIAKTKSELASIRVQAALIFSDDDDYDDVCTNANVLALLGASPAVCDDTPST